MSNNIRFSKFFSIDDAKAEKSQKYGWLNAISYMAPHTSAGVGNLCPNASAGCIALCLGEHSGQAAMVSKATGTNAVRESRKAKARYFMRERQAFMVEAAIHIAKTVRRSRDEGMGIAIRMNGATDVSWEGVWFVVDAALAAKLTKLSGHDIVEGRYTLLTLFHFVQFVDYTKNAKRFDRALPANYHITFSRAEDNEAKALELLGRGVNVAVVFETIPETWHGFPVVSGDDHDLRHLDPKGGYVIGLTPKGNKAKRDTSGFVVR